MYHKCDMICLQFNSTSLSRTDNKCILCCYSEVYNVKVNFLLLFYLKNHRYILFEFRTLTYTYFSRIKILCDAIGLPLISVLGCTEDGVILWEKNLVLTILEQDLQNHLVKRAQNLFCHGNFLMESQCKMQF
jgi:hypothetical protein